MSLSVTSLRRVALGAALITTSLGTSGQTYAHESDAPGDHKHGPFEYDYRNHRSPQNAAFELRVGPYLPAVDSVLNGTPYANAFGDKPGVTVGLEADWQVLRIPHFGTLGPGVGVHWMRRSGTAPFTDGTSGSAHKQLFWVMPMYGVAVLRVDVLARDFRIPFVPYVKGGLAWGLWEARDSESVSKAADGTKGRGFETGWQYQLGAMILLNPLAPQPAIDMDNTSGVNNAYLFIEWWASDVDTRGRGMQIGTQTWVAGLAIEY